ncbi:MAG: hypothetical protein NT121_12170 [Chloroflexi bacterium]|nr:hypothetical protein [Chloroflexota bacterium]
MQKINFDTSGSLPARPISESYWVIPGRLLAGEYPGEFSIEVTHRRLDAFLLAGFDTMIDLTCEGEAVNYAALLRKRAVNVNQKVRYLRFPIGDFGLPTHQMMFDILDVIDQTLAKDRKIYLHCYGGIGRTGTTVGCFLVRHGCSGSQALEQLALWWKEVPKSAQYTRSPETSLQEQFVANWLEQKK